MKSVFLWLPTVVIGAFPLLASAQTQVAAGNTPAAAPPRIVPPKGNLTADEYAIALANAADENLIMDATEVPAETRVPAYPRYVPKDWAPIFYSVLNDFRGAAHFSVEEVGTTALLRHAPDVLPFARTIIASGELESNEPIEDVTQLQKDLYEYAQKNNGWTDDAPKQRLDIKIADLPQPLRERALRMAHQRVLLGTDECAKWLSDDFWSKGWGLVRPGEWSGSQKHPPQLEMASLPKEGQTPQFYQVRMYYLEPSRLTNAYIARIYKR